MKKIVILSVLIVTAIGVFFLSNVVAKANYDTKITKEMAYEGVNNYCHSNYDWSIKETNPSIMYINIGEELDNEYQIIFRSYTGAFVNFYVNKETGMTRIIEKVSNLDIENSIGTININDYL